MIQVLERAFTALEWLAARQGEPVGLSEIARQLQVTPATCSHIVKTLVALGYLEQAGAKRSGYRLGPMVHYLSQQGGPHEALRSFGEPIAQAIADRTGEGCVLAVFSRNHRLILVNARGAHAIQVNVTEFFLDDLFQTATGWVLVAHLPADRLEVLLDGLKEYPAVAPTREQLLAKLAEIRSQPLFQRVLDPDVIQLGGPVRCPDGSVAALGCYTPRYRFDREHGALVRTELQSGIARLEEKLREYPRGRDR